ncbi:MAG: hypothetical protein ACAI43_26000 [Phycisphaerae bacterium]|nr:hypothetical protein [Tepidisphaeraceae bacterium]
MPRRILLYFAVCSLAALGLASATTAVLTRFYDSDLWIFSTPYGVTTRPPHLALRIFNLATTAQSVLFPVAAIATAAYLLALDRAVRRSTGATRGFDVRPVERIDRP